MAHVTFSRDASSGWKTFYTLYESEFILILKLSMKIPFLSSKDFVSYSCVDCLIFISITAQSGFFPYQSFFSSSDKISFKMKLCAAISALGLMNKTELLHWSLGSSNRSKCLQFRYHALSWSTFQWAYLCFIRVKLPMLFISLRLPKSSAKYTDKISFCICEKE